jgi:hypothetical protein
MMRSPFTAVCSRAIRIVLCGGVLWSLAGCQRANPLDLRVKAETPHAFFEWQDTAFGEGSGAVADEFRESVARIVATSPSKMSLADPGMMHSEYHPICRELNRRTVREVIIAGYSAVNQELLRGMIHDSDNLLVTLKHHDLIATDAIAARRFDQRIDRRKALLDLARAQVEANQRRIGELRGPSTPRGETSVVRFLLWRVLLVILL